MGITRVLVAVGFLVLGVAAIVVAASFIPAVHADRNDPEGTWLLTVRFPPEVGIPPFTELLAFHEGGTLTETNAILHANSANPQIPQFNFNGSDGYGAWNRSHGDSDHDDDDGDGDGRVVEFTFIKLVFDGNTNQHVGFLRVDARALIVGDRFFGLDTNTEQIFGPDPDTGQVIRFGGAESEGRRIKV